MIIPVCFAVCQGYPCANQQCLHIDPSYVRCNGTSECTDGSDELFCSTSKFLFSWKCIDSTLIRHILKYTVPSAKDKVLSTNFMICEVFFSEQKVFTTIHPVVLQVVLLKLINQLPIYLVFLCSPLHTYFVYP